MKFKNQEEQMLYALRTLSKHFSYNRKLIAKALGVELVTVNQWFARGKISALKAIEAEKITGGKIKKVFLRPDVLDWID